MTFEITVHVSVTKPHTMTSATGIQGYAPDPLGLHARPALSDDKPTNVGVSTIGTPTINVYRSVRRGDDGMSAARMHINIIVPTMPRAAMKASARRTPSVVVRPRSATKPMSVYRGRNDAPVK